MKDWMVITLYILVLFVIPLCGFIAQEELRPNLTRHETQEQESFQMAYNGATFRIILPR